MAFFAVEPFGEARDDLRMAILAAAIVNPHRGRGQRPFVPADFLPDFWGTVNRQSEIQAETLAERNERLLPKIRNLRVIYGRQN